MHFGDFVDFGESGLQMRDVSLFGIKNDGHGLAVQVAFKVLDATSEGDVLLNFCDASLTMYVYVEDNGLPFAFCPNGHAKHESEDECCDMFHFCYFLTFEDAKLVNFSDKSKYSFDFW